MTASRQRHDPNRHCNAGRRAVLKGSAAVALALAFGRTTGTEAGSLGSELIFLTDLRDDRLAAFDIGALELLAQTRLPAAPSHLIANGPNGLVAASEPASGRIWLLTGQTLAMRHEIKLDVSPWLVAFSPDGMHLAVADMSSGLIQMLDPATGKTRFIVGGFAGAHDLRFSADSSALYVSGLDDAIVRRLDLASQQTGTAFVLDGADAGIDHLTRSVDGRRGIIVTPIEREQLVAVVDLQAGHIVRRWTTDRHIWRAYTDPFSRWFLLASDRNPGLDVYDTRSGNRLANVELDMNVDLLTAGFVGSSLVVGERASGRLALIDSHDLSVAAVLDLETPVRALFMDDATGRVAVVTEDGDIVSIGVVPKRGILGFQPAQPVRFDIKPDLSAHANALSFCHS